MVMRLMWGGLALTGLAACGEPPQDFTIIMEQRAALGYAEPTEFSDGDLQSALRTLCSDRSITNFTTTTHTDGTTFFGANCPAGYTVTQGAVVVSRIPSGALTLDLPS